MLNDLTGVTHIYVACGYTDLRRGIDGLAAMVQHEFQLDPTDVGSIFLFFIFGSFKPFAMDTEKASIASPTPSKILLTTKTKLQLILTSQFFS